jgi:hypothetical protein
VIWRWGTVRARRAAAATWPARWLPAGLAAGAVLSLLPAGSAPAERGRGPAWSRPVTLAGPCRRGALLAPRVAVPSEGPSLRTGAGAVVWATGATGAAGAAGCGGSGPPGRLVVARLGAAEQAGTQSAPPLHGTPAGLLEAAGTSFGRLVATASVEAGEGAPVAEVLQGRAPVLEPAFSARSRGAGPALAHAYLGDAAVATVRPEAIAVRVERHYQHEFEHPKLIAVGPQPVSALTITMDFRADVLVVWEQGGAVYAHMLRQSGRKDPTQRLGPSGPRPVLQALVSDNDHGMVAWSSTNGPRTSVYLDLSQAGVTFARARTLVSFEDPAHAGRLPGSLALIRLSTENVLMAWTAFEHGHYVVRSAPAVFAASRATTRLSDPDAQSVLAAFAPGAAGEAVAVWSGTATASNDASAGLGALWADRVAIVPHDRAQALRPALLARPGAGAGVSAAVDPGSDRALVAWLAPSSGAIQYATAAPSPAYSQRPPRGSAPPPHAGTHWVRIAAAAIAAIAIATALALLWRRRAQRARGAAAGSRERRL